MKRPYFYLLAVFVWSGCSGSQPGPGAEEDRYRTESAFCAEWAKAACNEDVVAACNGSRSGCLETQESACRVLVPIGYASDEAQVCLDAVEDAYADARLDADELEIVLKLGGDCSTLVDGGRSEGESCTNSFECNGVDGFECVVKAGDAEGTCQEPIVVGGGRDCTADEAICEDDFYCDGENCIERSREDDACTSDETCEVGLRCDSVEGVCLAKVANAMSCASNDECASGICIGTTNKVCASTVVLTVESSLCDALR
jgi:hypothetical protein